MWRLQELHKPDMLVNRPRNLEPARWHVNLNEVVKAIMEEIGTDDRTLIISMDRLLKFGWLKRHNRQCFEIKNVPE